MITTLDNKIVKRGDTVWEIGITPKGLYKPTISVIYGGINHPANPKKIWADYDLCLKECDKLNANTKTR